MTPVLQTRGLEMRFGTTVALSGVDLQVSSGECIGLVGPNGSGRSTLLRVLATLLRPSSGSLEIDGLDAVRQLHEVRKRIAYVGDAVAPGDGLSVREQISFVVRARSGSGKSHVDAEIRDALRRAGVDPDAGVDTLSLGTRRRLSLTTAFLVRPRVLLLDDPFAGLDPDARVLFSVWLTEVRDAGTAVVAALNEDRDVRSICQRVVRLEHGGIVAPSSIPSVAPRRVQTPATV